VNAVQTLPQGTDPSLLYDRYDVLLHSPVFTGKDVNRFAGAYDAGARQEWLQSLLVPARAPEFRKALLDALSERVVALVMEEGEGRPRSGGPSGSEE
jgi:hypothetical protein